MYMYDYHKIIYQIDRINVMYFFLGFLLLKKKCPSVQQVQWISKIIIIVSLKKLLWKELLYRQESRK